MPGIFAFIRSNLCTRHIQKKLKPRGHHDWPDKRATRTMIEPRARACIYQRANNEPAFDLPGELYRIAGVDLTDIPGVSANTAQTILSEVGPNVSRFRNASAFAFWLGLSPEKQISGGKTLRTKTRKVKNRAAIAQRLGASCLYHAKNYFGEFFRRLKFRLGTPQAITATAHKLARVIYHMRQTKQPYSETILVKCDELATRRAEARLRRQVWWTRFSGQENSSFLDRGRH